jgi:hypothetical protein
LQTNDQIVKQELSPVFKSIIQKSNFDQNLLKKVLTFGLFDVNENVVRDSVHGFKALADCRALDNENINTLVEKASNANCDDYVR